jgi:hypothetical protein
VITKKRITSFFIILLPAALLPFAAYGEESPSFREKLYDDYQTEVNGFLEARGGVRTDRDLDQKRASIEEVRFQLDLTKDWDWGIFKLKGDLLADAVVEALDSELRELNLTFSPLDMMDIKAGRQTMTWGTGDLIFINDLFPKDWESFFIGRDDEYLKNPSDALNIGLFFDYFNLDLIYMPEAETSIYIDGSRLSYWNPMLGKNVGRDAILGAEDPQGSNHDGEFATRLSKNISSVEIALYGFYGFWKTPEGFNPETGKLTYPGLVSYGASVRGPLLGGISNVEAGFYDSQDDPTGSDPNIRNSEYRFLAGFEREVAQDLTAGFQYYMEYMDNYDQYLNTLPQEMNPRDKKRHLLTLRLTLLLMHQTLNLSLFTFYSPSDDDAYLRPKINYKVTDQLAVELGGNIFTGDHNHTFFGQFEDNTNIYASVRWSY